MNIIRAIVVALVVTAGCASDPSPTGVGPATKLQVVSQPTSGTLGGPLTAFEVRLLNAGNEPVRESGVSISAALASGTGTLAGTTPRLTNSDGTAAFADFVINGTAGDFTISFTSGTLQGATSAPIALSGLPATKLEITAQPTSGTVGIALTPAFAVRLLNASNQPVAQGGVAIAISLASGSATLGGTLTKNTAADGTVSFSDITVSAAGTYTFGFNGTGLTSVTSTPVTVSPVPNPSVCGSTGSGATVTAISRDAGSTAGGVTVLLTGTGFQATDCVTFGTTNATGIALINATTLQAVVPARAEGTVNVSVVQNGNTSTLANGFTYFPARTTTFITHNFDNGQLAPFVTFNGSGAAVSTDVARSGTFSIKASAPPNDGNNHSYWHDFPANTANPPVSEPNGLYARWYLYLPTSTITSLTTTGGVGQIKLHLARYFNPTSAGWLMCGIGNAFELPGDVLECVVDNGLFDINPQVKPKLAANTWHEIQIWYKRDVANNTGLTRVWVNGKQILNSSHPALGQNPANAIMGIAFGLVFTQLVNGPLIVYTDDATIANGFIDP